MTTMTATMDMTPREYAVSLRLAKMGKGRMSPAAHAAIKAAEDKGVVFKVPAHILAAQERAANPKRKKSPKADNVVPAADGGPTGPSEEWLNGTFAFGNFVRNPEGVTLRVTSETPDSTGFTHFITEAGLRKKAKVNARWGTAKGWPERKGYTRTNEA